jgi:hypothetical protein
MKCLQVAVDERPGGVQAFSGEEPPPRSERHPLHAAHTTTFFSSLWDEVQDVADAGAGAQASQLGRSSTLPLQQNGKSGTAALDAAERAARDADSHCSLEAAVEEISDEVAAIPGVEETLRRHLSLTSRAGAKRRLERKHASAPASQLPLLAEHRHGQQPAHARAIGASKAAASDETGHLLPGESWCSNHQRQDDAAGAVRERTGRREVEAAAQALPELEERKKLAEVEWAAQKWRRNARQYVGSGAADGGAPDKLTDIGNVAVRAMQARARLQANSFH